MPQYGFIPKNEDVPGDRFVAFQAQRTASPTKPVYALIYQNQSGIQPFVDAIDYHVELGRQMKAKGIAPYWNLPFPGPGMIERVASGELIWIYVRTARAILAIYDQTNQGKIPIRLPWELNLPLQYQSNAGFNAQGQADPALVVKALRLIAGALRAVSPRFLIDWNVNVGKEAIQPDLMYPGDDMVDVISQDWYMQSWAAGKTFEWWRDMPFGLAWGLQFAKDHGKFYGWTEYGAEHESFAPELKKAHVWANVNRIWHALYWDRNEVIPCRLSAGEKPLCATAYLDSLSATTV